MACIIAESLQIQVPSVAERRKVLAKAVTRANLFSLHSNPRTRSGILSSFEASSASYLLQTCKRVQPTVFDSYKTEKLHCHLLQSLVNIQMKANGAPVLPDLASLRCLLVGERVSDFLPIATILGALQTFELFKVLHAKRNEQRTYKFTLPSLTNGGGGLAAYRLKMSPLDVPLQVKSLAMEATRGGPLRVIPENFTAWSKITVPLSKELQSVDAIVHFIQTKHQVEIHALVHDKSTVLTLDARKKKRPEELSMSIFELVARSKAVAGVGIEPESLAPFVLVDVVAVDARGDVAFPPFRIQRFVEKAPE
ncbi:hypothetical protein Gpo141_00002660 [Globisporangium polare]